MEIIWWCIYGVGLGAGRVFGLTGDEVLGSVLDIIMFFKSLVPICKNVNTTGML